MKESKVHKEGKETVKKTKKKKKKTKEPPPLSPPPPKKKKKKQQQQESGILEEDVSETKSETESTILYHYKLIPKVNTKMRKIYNLPIV